MVTHGPQHVDCTSGTAPSVGSPTTTTTDQGSHPGLSSGSSAFGHLCPRSRSRPQDSRQAGRRTRRVHPFTTTEPSRARHGAEPRDAGKAITGASPQMGCRPPPRPLPWKVTSQTVPAGAPHAGSAAEPGATLPLTTLCLSFLSCHIQEHFLAPPIPRLPGSHPRHPLGWRTRAPASPC